MLVKRWSRENVLRMDRVTRNTRNREGNLFETDDHAQSGKFSSGSKMNTVKFAELDEGIYVIVDLYNSAMTTQPNCGEPSTNLLGSAKRCEVTRDGHRMGIESVNYDISCTVRFGVDGHSLAHHSPNGVSASVDFTLCRKINWHQTPIESAYRQVTGLDRASFVSRLGPRFGLGDARVSEVRLPTRWLVRSVPAIHDACRVKANQSGACANAAYKVEEYLFKKMSDGPVGSRVETIGTKCRAGFGEEKNEGFFDETDDVSEIAQWVTSTANTLSRNEDLRRFG